MVPAHIDRNSYSILANLGGIPKEIPGKILELSKKCNKIEFVSEHAELSEYIFIQNSDAHQLRDISDSGNSLEFPSLSMENFDSEHVIHALREMTFK